MLKRLEKNRCGRKIIAWLKKRAFGKDIESSQQGQESLFSLANARGVFPKRKLTFAHGICSPITT